MCGEAWACLKASVFDGLALFAMAREDDYAPLLQDEHDIEEARESGKHIHSWGNLSNAIILLQSIVIVVLLIATSQTSSSSKSKALVYSPANHLILEEKIVKFHSGIGNNTSIYMGEPSPELDRVWEDLYGFGISKVSKNEADQLPMKTVRVPSDPSHYIVQLDVFHSLHCLNMIRKALHPNYYQQPHSSNHHGQVDAGDENEHLAHCLEHLRQSVICSSDVSTIVWQWIPERNQTMGRLDVPHTCRDFEKISEWARQPENRLHYETFDLHVRPSSDVE